MNKDIAPALDEISAILAKRDMVGLIIVGSKTHCDWRMVIEASWSCARLDELPGGGAALRVRCKREDYESTESQNLALEQTVGAFVTFQHTLTKLNEQLDTVLAMIAKNGVNFLGKSTEEP